MIRMKWLGVMIVAAATAHTAWAQSEGGDSLHVYNRLRIEYDDNIFQEENNEDDSLKIVEEVDLSFNVNLPQSFIGLHYKPSFVWWDDRSDDTDLHHAFDAIFNHNFSSRLSIGIKDRFRLAEVPEEINNGFTIREENDYIYNSINGTLTAKLSPETKVDLGGRHILLQYDDDGIGRQQDYNRYVGAVSLTHELKPTTTVLADARVEEIAYEDSEGRDATSYYVGVGVDQTFTPNLLGAIRAGYQQKDFSAAGTDSTDSPYVDASFTLLPVPSTRLTLGTAFSQSETDLFPFANQERLRFYATLAQEVTAKIDAFLSAGYADGDYKAEEAASGFDESDGNEEVITVSLRATYEVNKNHVLEAGWQLVDLDSDFGRTFTRNRVNLGWSLVF